MDERQVRALVRGITGRRDVGTTDPAARAVAAYFDAVAATVAPTPPSTGAAQGGAPADDAAQGGGSASDAAGGGGPTSAARGGGPTSDAARGEGPAPGRGDGPDPDPGDPDRAAAGAMRVRRVLGAGGGAGALERPAARVRLAVVAAVLVLAAVAVLVTVLRPSSAGVVDGERVVMADDFDADGLDPTLWNRPERPDVVAPRDGALHFVVGARETADGLHTGLAPRGVEPFREVSFVVAVPGYERSGPGGVALIVTEGTGRNHRVLFGPSAGGPEIAALFCDRAFCSEFDDYLPPPEYVPFEVGEQVPVRLVAAGQELRLYVRDRMIARSPFAAGPLASFSFDIYGADEEAWDIAVDSFTVLA